MNNRLTFNEEAHQYLLDGNLIKSVTQILTDEGIIDTRWFTPEAAERGTLVHKATQFLDAGNLDWFSLREDLIPYVNAYEKFVDETGFHPVVIEQPVFDEGAYFAGTPDRIGPLTKLNIDYAVVDIKTGSHQKWWGLQTAAYSYASQSIYREFGILKRFSLELRKNGSYDLREHNNRSDIDDFLAIVRVHHWKNKNKVRRD